MMGSALRSDADNLYRRDIIQSTNSESLEEEDFYEGKEICNFTGCLAMIFFSIHHCGYGDESEFYIGT